MQQVVLSYIPLPFYYKQKHQVQYDSYRKNLYSTPEDATSQHIVYTVCSGFTFQTYYQTLGINLDLTSELSIITGTNFINQIIDVSGTKPVVKDDTILSKMLVNGGYGGTYFTTASKTSSIPIPSCLSI